MESTNWVVMFRWVKAHAGILGNEIADTLAKKAGKNASLPEDYKRIPKSVILKELKEA
jgi:ribonuclease HI